MNPILAKTLLAGICCSLAYAVTAQNALYNNGASITLQSSAAIYVQGNLENAGAGSFSNNGSIYVSGNLLSNASVNLNAINAGTFHLNGTALQSISGSSIPNFYNLTINKSAAQAQLQSNISLSNLLTLTSGSLFLNNYQADLLTTGALSGETATRRVYDNVNGNGTIKVSAVLNAPSAANPGNLGAIITAPQNLGLTTITRGNKAQMVISAYGIARYYDIIPTNNSNLTASLRFMYEDAELNGQIESDIGQWHSVDNITWQRRFGTLNTVANYVDLNNINWFKRVTLTTNNMTVLPLTLIEFTATKSGEKTLLHWKTVDEINIDHFEIERSADGTSWSALATTTAHNAAGFQYYDIMDPAPLLTNYYRLKIIDRDHKAVYSPIRLIRFDQSNTVKIYPTFATHGQTLYIDGLNTRPATVEVFDSRGRLVQREALKTNSFTIQAIAPGNYHVRVTDSEKNQLLLTQKVLIQ